MTDLLASSGSFLVELAVRATFVLLGALAARGKSHDAGVV